MQQAKDALLLGLDTLKPADRFNVIRFDDTYDVLFRDAVPASAEMIGQAKAFVAALTANGGTEMVPPLKAATTAWDGDWAEAWRLSHEIAWGDCDDAGIVFYPHFFRWMDTAFHRWLRERGVPASRTHPPVRFARAAR